MAVQMNRQADCLTQRRDQITSDLWCQQAGHVLDSERVAAHAFELACEIDEVRDVMHRARGVADCALGMFAGFFDRLDRNAKIAQIVHGIEHAEDVYTVIGRFLYEGTYHVIGVMAVAKQILPA